MRSTWSRANVACSPAPSSEGSNGSTSGGVSSRRQPDRFRDWRHRRFDAARRQAGFVVQTVEAPPACIAGRAPLAHGVRARLDRRTADQALVRPTLPPPPRRVRARRASPCDVLATTRQQNLQTLQMRLVIRSKRSSPPLSAHQSRLLKIEIAEQQAIIISNLSESGH